MQTQTENKILQGVAAPVGHEIDKLITRLLAIKASLPEGQGGFSAAAMIGNWRAQKAAIQFVSEACGEAVFHMAVDALDSVGGSSGALDQQAFRYGQAEAVEELLSYGDYDVEELEEAA